MEAKTESAKLEGAADKGARVPKQDPQVLKEMIRSAQNKAEHILTNEIALSQMIRALSGENSSANRPSIAKLRLALQAIREGDLETASELIQRRGQGLKQGAAASTPVSENARDPKAPGAVKEVKKQ